MIYTYNGKPVFADEDQIVRIYDGVWYEGAFMRYTECDFPVDGPRSEGPFVLLSDYQALRDRVYGKTQTEVCDGETE